MTQIRSRRVKEDRRFSPIDANSEEKIVPSKLDGQMAFELEGHSAKEASIEDSSPPRKIKLTAEITIDFDIIDTTEETREAVWALSDLQLIDLLTKDLEKTLAAEKVQAVGFHRI